MYRDSRTSKIYNKMHVQTKITETILDAPFTRPVPYSAKQKDLKLDQSKIRRTKLY